MESEWWKPAPPARAGFAGSTAPTIFGLQEVARGDEGWSTAVHENWTVLSYQGSRCWRGLGLLSKQDEAQRVNFGSWCRVRHLHTLQEDVWAPWTC